MLIRINVSLFVVKFSYIIKVNAFHQKLILPFASDKQCNNLGFAESPSNPIC